MTKMAHEQNPPKLEIIKDASVIIDPLFVSLLPGQPLPNQQQQQFPVANIQDQSIVVTQNPADTQVEPMVIQTAPTDQDLNNNDNQSQTKDSNQQNNQ
jgi:hypothetical protein